MKKTLFGALSILALASCSSDNNEIFEEEKMETVSFTVSSTPETRAYWSANQIYWNSSDVIKVFATNHTDGSDFTIKDYRENYANLTFTGKTYVGNANHTHTYFAVYPSGKVKSFDGSDLVTVEIPSSQSATYGSFDRDACIQIGKANNFAQGINLQNVCAFLKIEVTAPCSSVTVSSDGNFGVAGTVKVNSDGAINSSTGWDSRATSVSLNNLPEAGTYLIAIAPSASGYPVLNVSVQYPGCEPRTNSAQNVSIARGYVYDLGRCDKPQAEASGSDMDGEGGNPDIDEDL